MAQNFPERLTLFCEDCKLTQFETKSGKCRKCGAPYAKPAVVERTVVVMPPRRQSSCPEFDIGAAVRILRSLSGLSQRQAAFRLGAPRTYVSKVENNTAIPTLKSLERFAGAFRCSTTDLVQLAMLCKEAQGYEASDLVRGADDPVISGAGLSGGTLEPSITVGIQ